MTIKTLFTVNTQGNTGKTVMLSDTQVTTTVKVKVENEDIYKVLADYSTIIQNMMYLFSLGRFKEVARTLTRNYYQYLSVKLSKISYFDYPIYEQLRRSTKFSLEGLYKSIEQYSKLTNTETILKNTKAKAAILDDMVKLKEYINGLKKQVSVFPDMNITIIRAEIKPEYAEYIRMYGFPEGGIFDMDKLAEILIRMELNNLI